MTIADTLTNEENAAIAAFETNLEDKAEQERREDMSLEERYIDAFHRFTEQPDTRPHIMELLAGFAAILYDDDIAYRTDADPDLEVPGSDPNNCQFNQNGLMRNFCNQLTWMVRNEDRQMQYKRKAAARARYQHKGGDIDLVELDAAELAYGRAKNINLPLLEDMLKASKAAYVAQFGEEWTPPVKKMDEGTTRDLDQRFEATAKRSAI